MDSNASKKKVMKCVVAGIALSCCYVASFEEALGSSLCGTPPYGDTQGAFKKLNDAFNQVAARQDSVLGAVLRGELRAALIEACKAKFEHGSRNSYYRNGIDDAQIDSSSTSELANRWIRARNASLAEEQEQQQEQLKRICETPPYGSAVSTFKGFIAKWSGTDAISLVSILEMTCRAKHRTGDRRALYTVGLTDDEIDQEDPIKLADTWISATVDSIRRNPKMLQPSPYKDPQ